MAFWFSLPQLPGDKVLPELRIYIPVQDTSVLLSAERERKGSIAVPPGWEADFW
jgi:hypothetical protein